MGLAEQVSCLIAILNNTHVSYNGGMAKWIGKGNLASAL